MDYDYTKTERQKRYRERMYKEGFKKLSVWVKRKESKFVEMNMNEFVRRLKKLTKKWSPDKLSDLLNLYIKIANGKKEGK